MAATDILLLDNAQESCTSFSDVIGILDCRGSEHYLGPAARELSRRYTSGLALLDYRSPGTDGVEPDGSCNGSRPGTAGVRVTCCAAAAIVRHVMPMTVDLGRPIPSIEEVSRRR
jgi:hypothetical protein